MSSQLPLSGSRDEYGADFEATPTQPADKFAVFRYATISPGYLDTMHIALTRGRLIDAHDSESAPLVAVISASLARARFGSRDPLGQRLRVGPAGPLRSSASSVTCASCHSRRRTRAPCLPEPQWRFSDAAVSVVFRARGSASEAAAAVRQAIWSVDSNLPIVRVASMDALVAATAPERRFALVLFEAFAIAALPARRGPLRRARRHCRRTDARDRRADGARRFARRHIVGLVLRQGMLLTGVGVAVGLAGAAMATDAMSAMLFSVSHLDPPTYTRSGWVARRSIRDRMRRPGVARRVSIRQLRCAR